MTDGIGFEGHLVPAHLLDLSSCDSQQVAIRRQLFELESQLPPVDVIFLYKIIEWVGEVSDRAERVGSRLQILTAR